MNRNPLINCIHYILIISVVLGLISIIPLYFSLSNKCLKHKQAINQISCSISNQTQNMVESTNSIIGDYPQKNQAYGYYSVILGGYENKVCSPLTPPNNSNKIIMPDSLKYVFHLINTSNTIAIDASSYDTIVIVDKSGIIHTHGNYVLVTKSSNVVTITK